MALITETNAQYYSGQQSFSALAAAVDPTFVCTFDTTIISAFNSTGVQIGSASNYTIYLDGVAQTESLSYVSNSNNNTITLRGTYTATEVYIQLKEFAIHNNYGGYSYISLNDAINNFIVGYVGVGKLIPSVKRTDVMFHAKRGLQEFSYDTLKSIKSQELNIPPSLSVPIPQDYVNHVEASWIDSVGVKHIIYPTRLTSNPTELPIQDNEGIPTQDGFGENLEANSSLTDDRWASMDSTNNFQPDDYRYPRRDWFLGQRYGLDPETAQVNGWFTINERLGTFSFSSDLASKLIILEYISDGLSVDGDMKIPKMAEQAIYMHIAYSILSGRSGVPEYVVRRYKQERFAALRNAKIRLSNIKMNEFVQVMRGKSKWIKH